jgi:hypothetical protein
MLHEAIYSLLSSTEADIYPGVGEQEVNPPFIVHTKVNTTPTPDKDGKSKNDFVIYRVAMYATTMAAAQTLADSVRTVLDEYTGVKEGMDILKIRFTNEENGYDEEGGFFFVMQTYQILIRLIT